MDSTNPLKSLIPVAFTSTILLGILLGCSHSPHHRKGHHMGHRKLHHSAYGTHRSDENRMRNIYRHPVETLKFFEIKPDMKVAEIAPGGGWYTEILGPYLKDRGQLHLTLFSDQSKRSYAPKLNQRIRSLTENKELFGKVSFSTLETPIALEDIGEEGTFDRVLTFRNVHNWMKDDKAKEVFKKFFKALKPGGILGVVEHRAKNSKKQDPKAASGYVREDYVIDLAKSVGFEFLAKSEINANYNDDSNHTNGVWTLPPRLRTKGSAKSESFYQAIGESDRMTVKFRKPLK